MESTFLLIKPMLRSIKFRLKMRAILNFSYKKHKDIADHFAKIRSLICLLGLALLWYYESMP